jgi:hypothetical protein
MGKVAKLVTITLTTRVVVDENAIENDIMTLALPRLTDKLINEPFEHLEEIIDDVEVPYDHLYDEYPFFDDDEDK